ncbi:hypothetical protein VKT23_009368 [Stygiomarasmius scandens]|uniref:Uncharacterized protein n=1 Tax=Marasmiellus scandens TaxID=2682957 RepID=A0ABR1JIK9_9AGAR
MFMHVIPMSQLIISPHRSLDAGEPSLTCVFGVLALTFLPPESTPYLTEPKHPKLTLTPHKVKNRKPIDKLVNAALEWLDPGASRERQLLNLLVGMDVYDLRKC